MTSNVADGGEKGDLPFLYTWKLERLFASSSSSGRNCNCSNAFHRGGYNWKLALYPGEVKAKDDKCYFSLFLVLLDATTLPPHLTIEVIVESSVLNGNDSRVSQCSKKEVIYKFRESKSEECYPFLVSLETLKCPSSGFLIVEIVDVVIRTEESEHLPFKLVDNSQKYTWIIEGFSKLRKQKYMSGPFLFNDYIWCLKLFPKGNGVDNFVSLYLELDEASTFPPTEKVYADFSIEWVDQINGQDHEKRSCHHFDPGEKDWGFTRFMSLKDLHEPSKGFLVNDSCIIKVTFLNFSN